MKLKLMRFIISLSIVLIAFDATKIRRIKRALRLALNFWGGGGGNCDVFALVSDRSPGRIGKNTFF
jgi:hypothetical protein